MNNKNNNESSGGPILTNRQWHVDGKWFEPAKFIRENFKSVVYCDYIDMTSSAGDWTGLIVQKLGNKLHVITFSQENCINKSGFDVFTDNKIAASLEDSEIINDYKLVFDVACKRIYTGEIIIN